MRSFRRSSKKSDGDEHSLEHYDVPPYSTPSAGSPAGSPILYSNQFTPPQTIHPPHPTSASSTTLSSPKKLLTPIRNLFHSSSSSSHFKSGHNIAAVNDNLNNALYSTKTNKSTTTQYLAKAHHLEVNHSRKHTRNSSSISSLQAIELEPVVKPKVQHSQSHLSLQEYRQRAMAAAAAADNANGFSHTFKATTANFHLPLSSASSSTVAPGSGTGAPSSQQQFVTSAPQQPFIGYVSSNKPMVIEGSQLSLVSQPVSLQSSHATTSSHTALTVENSSSLNLNNIPSSQSLKPAVQLRTSQLTSEYTDDERLEMESEGRNKSMNNSVESIAKSELRFKTRTASRKVSFKKKAEVLNKNHTSEDDSYLVLGSDSSSGSESNSSQFSFAKDMKGRNSSVKYYKTDIKPKIKVNTFNHNDLNYEVEDYSDYDFDNNGMEYDDQDDEDEDEEIGYNNAFGEDPVEKIGFNNAFDVENGDIISNYSRTNEFKNDKTHVRNLENDDLDASYGQDLEEEDYENEQSYGDNEYENDVPQNAYHEDNMSNINKTVLQRRTRMEDQFGGALITPIEEKSFEGTLPSLTLSLGKTPTNRKFNHSYHMSIQGIDTFSKPTFLEHLNNESEGNSDLDILENYLEIYLGSSKDIPSNSKNHSSESPEINLNVLEYPDFDFGFPETGISSDFEKSSPLINGITIGSNLRHRLGRPTSADSISHDNPDSSAPFSNPGFSKSSNSFIHRELPDVGLDKDIFQKRMMKSFHGSISDDFENIVSSKLKEHERFHNSRAKEVINESDEQDFENKTEENRLEQGLGLYETDDVPSIKLEILSKRLSTKSNHQALPNRNSVNDMMNLLQHLGESQGVFERSKNEKNSNANTPITTLQQKKDDSVTDKRGSIINLMSVLEKVEQELPNTKAEKQKRDSIIGFMNLLANLEGEASSTKTEVKEEITNESGGHENTSFLSTKLNKLNRNSINEMMDILSGLDFENNDVSESNESKKKKKPITNEVKVASHSSSDEVNEMKVIKSKVPRKQRYSWFNDDEEVTITSASKKPTEHENTGGHKFHSKDYGFDESMIDEINQLPEDFDFEQYQIERNHLKPGQSYLKEGMFNSSFLRSNSYNNRSSRMTVDNKPQSNKIETLNKTVTFYRSGSPQHLEINRSRSVSRAPSTRSSNSYISISESDGKIKEDEDELSNIEVSSISSNSIVDRRRDMYTRKFSEEEIKSPRRLIFDNLSSDSVGKNKLLGTISESAT